MPPEILQLLNYGVLGIAFALFVTGVIVAKPTLDDVKKERDDAKQAMKSAIDGFAQALDLLSKRHDS